MMMQRHFKRYRHLLKWNIPLKATCGNGGKKNSLETYLQIVEV